VLAGELCDQHAQALGKRDAAGVDANQRQPVEVGVLLDDLVRDPAQRPLQIGLVEQNPACDLGNAHPAVGSVVGQAHVILRLLPGLSGRGLKGHAGWLCRWSSREKPIRQSGWRPDGRAR
jgi:hypothetical protein